MADFKEKLQHQLSESFKFDVDHMNGPRVADKTVHHDHFERWKMHAERVNSQHHSDNAVIVHHPDGTVHYKEGVQTIAHWDAKKKMGTVQDPGKPS